MVVSSIVVPETVSLSSDFRYRTTLFATVISYTDLHSHCCWEWSWMWFTEK